MALTVIVAHNRYRSAQPSGENRVVDREMRLLERAGVRVIPFVKHSDDLARLPITQKALLPLSPIYSHRSRRELADLIKEHRPNLLHLHNPYPLLSPAIVQTAHEYGVKVVQTVHNYRHVCVSALFFRDGKPCHECLDHPLAAVRHRCYRGSLPQTVVMSVALRVHRPTWHSVERFIAPTVQIKDFLGTYGIPPDRITVKPNSAPDPGDPPSETGRGVLFAGRPTREKGIDLLVEACSQAGVPLRVVGGQDNVLDAAEMRAAIRASAIVAVPSLLDDVFPTIAIEALANGRPVIGTPFGGIPGIVGNAGWIIPANPDSWAQALPRALERAPALVRVARERYLRLFSPTKVTGELINAYRRTLGQRGPGGGDQAEH